MREFVRDDDANLVSRVAIQQRVEQHHALGRAEARDVGVGRGRAAARVDRVDLADPDARGVGELEHVVSGLPLGQRREVVEDRVEHDRCERREARADDDRARRGGQPPASRIAAGHGDRGGAGSARDRSRDHIRLGQVRGPAAPGLRGQPDRNRATPGDDRQRQRQHRAGERQARSGDAADQHRALVALSEQSRDQVGCVRGGAEPDRRPRERERQLRAREASPARDLIGAEVVAEIDRGGLDLGLPRREHARAGLSRGERRQRRAKIAVARGTPHQRDCTH